MPETRRERSRGKKKKSKRGLPPIKSAGEGCRALAVLSRASGTLVQGGLRISEHSLLRSSKRSLSDFDPLSGRAREKRDRGISRRIRTEDFSGGKSERGKTWLLSFYYEGEVIRGGRLPCSGTLCLEIFDGEAFSL